MKTPIPARDVLTEFGSKSVPKEPPADFATKAPSRHQPGPVDKKKGAASADKLPSFIEEAYARGLEEGKAAGRAEIDAKLEEQRQYLEKQHELERLTWASREASKLTAQLRDGLGKIAEAVTTQTARILKPFLIEQIRAQAIAELHAVLEVILTKGEGISLKISGPEDLLQLLREKLPSQGIAVEFVPSTGVDLCVTAGQTILETRLAAWMAKFDEVVSE